MAEKVARLGIERDPGYMYYVKDGAIWRVRRRGPTVPKTSPERVAHAGLVLDPAFIYFVDQDGDLCRARRQDDNAGEDAGTVHGEEVAFRVSVSPGSPRALLFEALAWPALSSRQSVTLPYPRSGYGGSALSISASDRYGAAMIYSGQSEVGYELFVLKPAIQHLGGLASVPGECDDTPPAFSPDERLVALAVEHNYWWVDPSDPEPDWDTPAKGGLARWSTLYVHDLSQRSRSEFPISVDLRTGWFPQGDGTWPRRLRFVGPRTLAVGVPWAAVEFTFDIPVSDTHIVAPSP